MALPRPEDALAYLDNYNPDGTKKTPGGKFNLKGKNLIMLIGFIAGISLIVVLIFKLMFSAPNLQNDLLSLSAKQQDLQRWAATAVESARTDNLLNQASSMNQFLASDNKATNDYIVKKYGLKDAAKRSKTLQDTKVDALLKSAIAGNRFDDEFNTQVSAKINTYKQSLRSINSRADTKTLKSIVSEAYNHIDVVKLP